MKAAWDLGFGEVLYRNQSKSMGEIISLSSAAFWVRRFPPIHCARSLKLRNVFALGYSTRWLYKNADSLPFTIRQKSDSVPFSKHGLENYLRNHRKQV